VAPSGNCRCAYSSPPLGSANRDYCGGVYQRLNLGWPFSGGCAVFALQFVKVVMLWFRVAERGGVVEGAGAKFFWGPQIWEARIACAAQIMRRRYLLMPRLRCRPF